MRKIAIFATAFKIVVVIYLFLVGKWTAILVISNTAIGDQSNLLPSAYAGLVGGALLCGDCLSCQDPVPVRGSPERALLASFQSYAMEFVRR